MGAKVKTNIKTQRGESFVPALMYVGTIILIALSAGIAGYQYGKQSVDSSANASENTNTNEAQEQSATGTFSFSGIVTGLGELSLTVESQDLGKTLTVEVTSSTVITKSTALPNQNANISLGDVTVGDYVLVDSDTDVLKNDSIRAITLKRLLQ